jgi:cytochrome c556
MQRFISLVLGLALLGLCAPAATPAPQPKVNKIMMEKLKSSQALLAGIATSDFNRITSNTEELIQLTKREEWQVIKTPRYEMNSNEFRRAAENIIQKARAKNIDGVTLAYFELTMSCVRCHQYVREVREARLRDGLPVDVAVRSPH